MLSSSILHHGLANKQVGAGPFSEGHTSNMWGAERGGREG